MFRALSGLRVHASPDRRSHRLPQRIDRGSLFGVSEQHVREDGRIFLRLASGRGWVRARGAKGKWADKPIVEPQATEQALGTEEEAAAWIEETTGYVQGGKSLREWLQSGVVLCALANSIHPGAVGKVSSGGDELSRIRNVALFLSAIRELGIPEHQTFHASDFCQECNMDKVVRCIHALRARMQPARFGRASLVAGSICRAASGAERGHWAGAELAMMSCGKDCQACQLM